MEYKEVVKDFAKRTLDNLEYIESRATDEGPYEVTQLVNSMLGLLVFPKEAYLNSIPETPIEELKEDGWPVPRVVGDFEQVEHLRDLVRYMRNGITHKNVEFVTAPNSREIVGIQLWNVPPGKPANWRVEIDIDELRELTRRFVQLIDDLP